MKTLDKKETLQARTLLLKMAMVQSELWDKSLELEKLVGFDIDTSNDLQEETIEHLREISDYIHE